MGKLYILTGAGLSAESGLATFRNSANSLWAQHDIAHICHFSTFRENREEVCSFYSALKAEYSQALPNNGHRMLARLQKMLGDSCVLLTQNLDTLLEQSGCTDVVHLHGSLSEWKCHGCGHVWPADTFDPATRCPKCSCLKAVKPNVVFFGEQAPAYSHLKPLRKLTNVDMFVAIGTSLEVLSPEDLLSPRRKGHPGNMQINQDLVHTDWFSVNLQNSVCSPEALVLLETCRELLAKKTEE